MFLQERGGCFYFGKKYNCQKEAKNNIFFSAFFHPYGEVAQIQVIGVNDEIPENVRKWCDVKQLVPKTHSAIVEFLTARTAKFVVGVLRKRLGQLTFKYFIEPRARALESSSIPENCPLTSILALD